MALKLVNAVRVTSGNAPDASTAYNLDGATVTGYRSFANAVTQGELADDDTLLYYAYATDANGNPNGAWEIGVGTFDSTPAPDTLTRTTIIATSNNNTTAIDWSATGENTTPDITTVFAHDTLNRLTAETAMAAADKLWMHDGTDNKSATFALLGGLVPGSEETPTSGDVTGAAGKLSRVNLGSLTADINFDLPATGDINVGELVGVYVTAGNSTATLREMDFHTAAAGDTIDGVDMSGGDDRLRAFTIGDTMVFRCVANGGAGSVEYETAYYGLSAQAAAMYLSTATDKTEAANTYISPTADGGAWTTLFDNNALNDLTNGKIVLRRSCNAIVAMQVESGAGSTVLAGDFMACRVRNATPAQHWEALDSPGANTSNYKVTNTLGRKLTGTSPNHTVEFQFKSEAGSIGAQVNRTRFLVWEVPTNWAAL